MFFKAPQWLVVFLGNPGDKYRNTRHNVGFMTADIFEKRENIKIKRIKYNALTAKCSIGGSITMLIKPQTYMNLSGKSVRQAASFYRIPEHRIIVISDDVSLEVGKLRIRRKGSAGGHNGLKSIISELGSDEFCRVRIGVGSPENPDYEMADWVLGKFGGGEKKLISKTIQDAADAVELIISEGIDRTMNKYN